MGERTVYFLFTDTGTYLSRAINYCTKQSLNHVSIAFDDDLQEVYSFGRKRPRNPFIGGFVKEDIRSDFLKDSNCAVYKYHIPEADCERVLLKIKEFEMQQDNYKYNFIGLIGVLLQIEINRENALFCSQFVATVFQETNAFNLSKPLCFTTPADIRNQAGLKLIYEGKLGEYQHNRMNTERRLITGETTALTKQSFIFILSKKVKRFVIR
ncbi:hypothetical protein [Virgibacillus oceani]|uniref:Uncharacterized protein n=1 Tax=Virgibacillus oceani TaxID=1479511 RepID=A0A917H8V5_9BACI|nr:hypothetical protein [Virgibacillus oceani]GGG71246.1 hypothetical protein GCM10011398_14340 [Virgibacillus oceani]